MIEDPVIRFRFFALVLLVTFVPNLFAQARVPELPDASYPQTADAARSHSDLPGAARESASGSPQMPLERRKAHLALLSQVSSKSPNGSSFIAKLQDAVQIAGKPLLPKGTLVEGHLETIPARRMLRRGALRMIFDRVKLPDGTIQPARFELSSTGGNSTKTDDEGTVHPATSKRRLAIQLGGTALVSKLADDLSEEALAAGAGSARWYGLAASATFLLLQKGREVRLNAGEIIEVNLVREGSPLPAGSSPR